MDDDRPVPTTTWERTTGQSPSAESTREQQGVVVEMLPRALFVVELDSNRQVVAHLSGDPQRNFVRIMTGDRVAVVLSSRDRTRGRITSKLE